MLNSVNEKEKATANSIAMLVYNLFGYLPAPAIYGLVSDFAGPKSTIPMGFLLYLTLPTVLILCFSIKFKLNNERMNGKVWTIFHDAKIKLALYKNIDFPIY